jgi:hypothetical protein
MRKQQAEKMLETVIGKLSHLNYNIQGNQLQEAIREVADVLNRLKTGELKIRKT